MIIWSIIYVAVEPNCFFFEGCDVPPVYYSMSSLADNAVSPCRTSARSIACDARTNFYSRAFLTQLCVLAIENLKLPTTLYYHPLLSRFANISSAVLRIATLSQYPSLLGTMSLSISTMSAVNCLL
jgi:hypothetical protein